MADVAWIVFSFLAFILNIAPLCWQIKHGNAGPVCLGVWVLIASLNSFVSHFEQFIQPDPAEHPSQINGVLWRNDAFNRAPIFCDISVKVLLRPFVNINEGSRLIIDILFTQLQAGTPIGILASVICILLLLARALRTQPKLTTARQRKLRAIFEYAFCLGWPAMTMILQVLWQSYRFGIAKDTGCAVPVANVWPFWAFYLIWTPVFSLIGALLSRKQMYLPRSRHELNKSRLDSLHRLQTGHSSQKLQKASRQF